MTQESTIPFSVYERDFKFLSDELDLTRETLVKTATELAYCRQEIVRLGGTLPEEL